MRAPFHIGLLNWAWDSVFSALVIASVSAPPKAVENDFEISAMVCVLYASVLGSPVAWDHYFVFAPLLVLVIERSVFTIGSDGRAFSRSRISASLGSSSTTRSRPRRTSPYAILSLETRFC